MRLGRRGALCDHRLELDDAVQQLARRHQGAAQREHGPRIVRREGVGRARGFERRSGVAALEQEVGRDQVREQRPGIRLAGPGEQGERARGLAIAPGAPGA